MDMDFIQTLQSALFSSSRLESEKPWRLVAHTSVGGAVAAGFDRCSEQFIVVSESGQSIFEGTDGSRAYRNREHSGFCPERLEAKRLDIANRHPINMAGDLGGGLCRTTSDGWSVDIIQIRWPTAFSILQRPGSSIYFLEQKWKKYNKDEWFRVVMKSEGLPVAFGFSWSGMTLVWLDRSDLLIWHRGS